MQVLLHHLLLLALRDAAALADNACGSAGQLEAAGNREPERPPPAAAGVRLLRNAAECFCAALAGDRLQWSGGMYRTLCACVLADDEQVGLTPLQPLDAATDHPP